jgi:outer membrane protein OmpA-like peptidoglycan-associated protein
MGARREAIQVSGVGENDLAVQTPDGVREAKNRRAVVTLLP